MLIKKKSYDYDARQSCLKAIKESIMMHFRFVSEENRRQKMFMNEKYCIPRTRIKILLNI